MLKFDLGCCSSRIPKYTVQNILYKLSNHLSYSSFAEWGGDSSFVYEDWFQFCWANWLGKYYCSSPATPRGRGMDPGGNGGGGGDISPKLSKFDLCHAQPGFGSFWPLSPIPNVYSGSTLLPGEALTWKGSTGMCGLLDPFINLSCLQAPQLRCKSIHKTLILKKQVTFCIQN